ncbi:hypothetical protein [Methanobacterium alcaliphilum]|uniref:hypothetical protein n=1 Tax=Methanobacterium alcaliphilum TaxID=392018 RepID=UPI00200A61E4|nr:hypothetical protein [Methanobacterium alcaliphilum]MCK9151542.1 hypothetical protein [Methanobacterium alcaliphilum]
MLNLLFKLQFKDLEDDNNEIQRILDEKFYFNQHTYDESSLKHEASYLLEKIDIKCQDNEKLFLYYIRDVLDHIGNINQSGRIMLHHIWPLFFSRYPSGQIWAIEIDQKWQDEIWHGQRTLAHQSGFLDKNPNLFSSQENSGFDSYHFPYNAFNIIDYGIYPLILTVHCKIFGLIFLYIPDTAITHSQMTEENTCYTKILWDMHHIFDDQWTFDSGRGPKNSADPDYIFPLEQLKYYEWFIELINDCMEKIISIDDFLKREQLVLTLNRAIFDAQLATINELPYMAKVFFFNFADKIANIIALSNNSQNDASFFKNMFDVDFIKREIMPIIEKIPDNAGAFFTNILKKIVNDLNSAKLSPDDLRYIRNTNHGYNLFEKNTKRIMEMDGEIDNDISLTATPFIIYILYKICHIEWNK